MGTSTKMKSETRPMRPKITRWSFLKRTMLFLVAMLVAYNAVFYIFQDAFLMEPKKKPTGYVERKDLEPALNRFLTPSGSVLQDDKNEWPTGVTAINFQKSVSPTQPAKGTLFYLHGNKGSMEQCRWEIEPFLDAGYHVWTMDYRKFGESRGPVNEIRLLGDAKMVYEEILKTEQIDIIWGRSFGSGIATYLASLNSPKRLVLETPYWSLPDAAGYTRPFLLSCLFRYRLPTNEYMEYVQCPVHMIHGKADEKITFESSKRLDKLCGELDLQGKFHKIPGGMHNFRPSEKEPKQTDAAFETALMESLDLKLEMSRKPRL